MHVIIKNFSFKSLISLQTHPNRQRRQKQLQKQTLLGVVMKNSNNIKRGVSTGDTLLLRALQTDRVTAHTLRSHNSTS